MGYLKAPKIKLTRESLGLTNYVRYDKYDPAHNGQSDEARKSLAGLDYSPLKRVTWESFWMGILISMGGMIFGYDTGQISGFLAMPDFLNRFGQRDEDGVMYFSNVRSGLIVSLVCLLVSSPYSRSTSANAFLLLLAFNRYLDRSSDCCSHRRRDRQKVERHLLVYHLLRRQHCHDHGGASLVSDHDGQMDSRSRDRCFVPDRAHVYV